MHKSTISQGHLYQERGFTQQNFEYPLDTYFLFLSFMIDLIFIDNTKQIEHVYIRQLPRFDKFPLKNEFATERIMFSLV